MSECERCGREHSGREQKSREELLSELDLTIEYMVSCLLFYDRKEDDDLGLCEIEEGVEARLITADEIVEMLRGKLNEAL